MQSVQEVIADAIARRRHAQRDLAQALGVSQQTVSRWVKGTNEPEPDRWPAIEEVLELPVGALAEAHLESIRRPDLAAQMDQVMQMLQQLDQRLSLLERRDDR